MTRFKNLIASIALVSFVSSSIVQPCFARVTLASTSRQVKADQNDGDGSKGLRFRLGEGSGEADRTQVYKPAVMTELSLSDTESILKRLPTMTVDANDELPFRLAERTPPPPLTGVTRTASFPCDRQ